MSEPRRVVVLAVDDMPHMKNFYRGALRELDIDFHYAENGEQACALAEQVRPDLVLMDFMMPRMNGEEATRIMRAMPGLETTRFVAVTAMGEEDSSALDGFDEILNKPIRADELVAVARRHLGLHAGAESR